jgi:hypothetical protein
MFLLTWITRSASSGFENRTNHIFDTIEEASTYIRTEWYDEFCEFNDYPCEWDEENLGGPMPSREDFTVEKIQKNRYKVLLSPFDKHHQIVQNELHLVETTKRS